MMAGEEENSRDAIVKRKRRAFIATINKTKQCPTRPEIWSLQLHTCPWAPSKSIKKMTQVFVPITIVHGLQDIR
jgi:hypothetical protein